MQSTLPHEQKNPQKKNERGSGVWQRGLDRNKHQNIWNQKHLSYIQCKKLCKWDWGKKGGAKKI